MTLHKIAVLCMCFAQLKAQFMSRPYYPGMYRQPFQNMQYRQQPDAIGMDQMRRSGFMHSMLFPHYGYRKMSPFATRETGEHIPSFSSMFSSDYGQNEDYDNYLFENQNMDESRTNIDQRMSRNVNERYGGRDESRTNIDQRMSRNVNERYSSRDEDADNNYESATGQNNSGLDAGLRSGFGGLAGMAGAAGLEGGLGHGMNSYSIKQSKSHHNDLENIEKIRNSGGPSSNYGFRQESLNNLVQDVANNKIGGVLGEAALNGNGGLTGAAGLGKIIGNEPGFGSNLGALAGIATSSGLNVPITMGPEDLGSEGKESLGATSRVAAAGKLGQSIGIQAGLNADITDKKSLETLAGLGQGMAVAQVLSNHFNAVKSQGIEGPAAKVAGYAGIPGSGGFGSFASLLGMGPRGSASQASARGDGDTVAENAAYNDVKLIKRLNEDIQRKKEDVIEDTLKKKMLETDLEEELKK